MANTRKKNNPNQAGIYLLFALGTSLALALILGPTLFPQRNTAATLMTTTTNNPMISESIGRLSSADSPSQRINAARWLSTQASTNPETVIRSLGDSLHSDPDPVVRAQAATSLGAIARQSRMNTNAANEKLIADLLQRQYSREASDTVRRCIIGAASELDIDDANGLVEKAIEDNDPSVKEEALRARLERERRAQLKKLG